MKTFIAWVAAILLAIFTSHAIADIYRCIGDNGEPLFTDQPCGSPVLQQDSGISIDHWTPPPALPMPTIPSETEPRRSAGKKRASPCDSWRAQVERIEARLRAGYREPTGNRLHAKKRELEERIFDECRQVD